MTDKELKDLVADVFRMQKETAEQMQKTDEQIEKTGANLDRLAKKTDEQMQKTDERLDILSKKTDAKLNRLGEITGGISNSQGDVAEEFFMNSIEANQKVAGIQYDMMYKNLNKIAHGVQDEFDIVLVNGKDVLLIEIKYKLHKNDIEKLLNTKKINFKRLFPEYKDYKLHLGLASFKIYDDLKNEALNNNIIILQRKGNIIENFSPSLL